MKKSIQIILFLTAFTLLLVSCGGNKTNETNTNTEQPTSMVTDAPSPLEQKIKAGKTIYENVCKACHQADGKGLPKAFPPLAQSDYLEADINRAIAGVVNGLSGEITVNGVKYNQVMPKSTLNDEEIAAAFTYVLNQFGNKGGEINADQVKAQRK